MRRPVAALAATFVAATPTLGIDLSRVAAEHLDNGLTVLVLEEHEIPVVSVQMLYRVGARDEAPGRTGLAHFVEHMAYRATRNFPGSDVVRRIYDVGGEWHGYTWIDQTTYYATVPVRYLDLLLAIEADRMSALVLSPDEVEAERGAVMAELRGYQEDPASVLVERVAAVSFLEHPYRYNSIGWASDVLAIDHADLVDFYRRHYVPANAVLAVVGDVRTDTVLELVRARFSGLASGEPAPLPRTVEPPQIGERRIDLRGETDEAMFQIGYHAPGVRSPDWPAFLLLQEILGGSSGVNFLQDTFGTAVRPGSRLAGLAATTWFSPAAQPYLFTISGSAPLAGSRDQVESRVESAVAAMRDSGPSAEEVAAAKDRLAAELVFDVETTEDAAHQLAFFSGLDALDVLLGLRDRLDRVTVVEIRDVARRYLQPRQRTLAWFLPEEKSVASSEPAASAGAAGAEGGEAGTTEAPPPDLGTAGNQAVASRVPRVGAGVPLIVRESSLSPAAYLRVVLPGTALEGAQLTSDDPAWDLSSIGRRFLPGELESAVRETRHALDEVSGSAGAGDSPFERALERAAGVTRRPGSKAPMPLAVALVGDVDTEAAEHLLERSFGDLERVVSPPLAPSRAIRRSEGDLPVETLPARPSGRAHLGYAVAAPPPGDGRWPAWRMLLYVMTHGYEGRIGYEAIHQRGLAYYVDSAYESDGRQAWVAIRISAEPDKLSALEDLVAAELAGLRERPPSAAETDAARRHLLGRRISAAQSNEEISARLTRDLRWFGKPLSLGELEVRLNATTPADLAEIIPSFLGGRLIVEPVVSSAPR